VKFKPSKSVQAQSGDGEVGHSLLSANRLTFGVS
jgi:hypothetical protein